MNKWYRQLFKQIDANPGLQKMKVSEATFSENYQGDFSVADAIPDLVVLATIGLRNRAQARLVKISRDRKNYSIKLFTLKDTIPLSQSMPMFESMGLQVLIGRPYRIKLGNRNYWINHFTLERGVDLCDVDPEKVPRYFSELFESIWRQRSENDDFNHLLFNACIKADNIQILRAYTAYLQQIRFPHSREYIIETLNSYPDITLLLVKAFLHKFDPQRSDPESYLELFAQISEKLHEIESLDHDLIYQRMLNLIDATVRTGYFQQDKGDTGHISFKMDSLRIEQLPKPSPRFEIYVYASRFEGIHLRGGLVARGGIRWSDRREDYRTEVLGLMKAQMVKNAVIVPAGSKGGFITKQIAQLPSGEIYAEVQACYSLYINALLEITDNRVGTEIEQPPRTRVHDGADPYLVVAADKGTAAFSDVANEIARKHGFWLDDAFASGGSQGYDHKKMGITARGAWEAVKRHFREAGLNTQTDPFTVAGIGDMAGDVFGNGLLLSRQIKLVAAFNHRNIFLDPNPDLAQSFRERQRLFKTPRTSWEDYNDSLISKGGGVYSRQAKTIRLSNEARKMLDSQATTLKPDELIQAILKMPVDLLWNGGIGTYVKASHESHADAGDRSNDAVRVDADELRCKVIGEGGNLGLTQLGRVEFSLRGGRINTDFIDNSAGVDSSDREVNIKILLSDVAKRGNMTRAKRNRLLESMTDNVADLVLRNNYLQTQSISMSETLSADRIDETARLISDLERTGLLNREIEFLPDEVQIKERRNRKLGFTRPELAVVLSYAKIDLYNGLIDSEETLEDFLAIDPQRYFPTTLRRRFADLIPGHRLSRQILATLVANDLVNRMGPAFAKRVQVDTGANIVTVARAYQVARIICRAGPILRKI
jgi:glutamate dehydrogenase